LCAELCHHVLSLKVYPNSSATKRHHGFHIRVVSKRADSISLTMDKTMFLKTKTHTQSYACYCLCTGGKHKTDPNRMSNIKYILVPTKNKKGVTRPMVGMYITYRKPSICRSTALLLAPPKCSQIFTNPPEGVCNDPFHRRPFTQTLLEDFHLWQRIAPSPRV